MASKYIIIDSKYSHLVGRAPFTLGFHRTSLNGRKIIVEYEGSQPGWVFLRVTKDLIGAREYSQSEIIEELRGPEWTPQIKGIT